MKIKEFLPVVAFALATGAGAQSAGIKLENMNQNVKPGEDFYEFACGGWMKNNPLTPEYARYGSFDALSELNNKRVREIIETMAAQKNEKGTVAQKVGDLYNMYMDSVRQNADGVKPVLKDLERVAKVKNTKQLLGLINEFKKEGVTFAELWGSYVGADMMNSTANLLEVYQGGFSQEREYYVEQDEANKQTLEAYKKHVVRMFVLMGESEKSAQKKMENVLKIEMRMAKAGKNNTDLRDAGANYHKMAFADFQKEYDLVDWTSYFAVQGITDIDSLSVGQPESLKEAMAVLKDEKVEVLKDWLQWNIIDGAGSLLGDEVYEENFDYYSRILTGATEKKPRWKRSVSAVNGVLGEAVGQLYVEKYFPAANKERMEKLVRNLQVALGERIDAQEWMSEETKKAAHEKLDAFYVKVGYPDKWRDYSKLTIDPAKSLYDNVAAATYVETLRNLEKFGKPVDKSEWGMTPQTVNAYYNPTTNEICFPAAILQAPFFDVNADDATNYGAIGVVIGHEMTHGFDDQGRNFNADGNMVDWWTAGDSKRFTAAAEKLAAQFDQITVVGDLKANGHLTLGENIADQGGLRISYDAFKTTQQFQEGKEIDGFTPAQRFYLSYGRIWAEHMTEEAIYQQTKSDPHSIGRNRVNATLRNIDTWYDAFGVKEGDKMWLAPAERAIVW